MKHALSLTFIALVLLFSQLLIAQNNGQIISGIIRDSESNEPLPGVHVVVEKSDPFLGAVSGIDGRFILNHVPLGRHHIKISLVGYEPIIIPELLVGSGKEIVLNQKLRESITSLNEVTVKAQIDKDKTRNDMAFISSRSFSIEEASRYAGGFNDPSRLAGSFAGVTMAEGINDNAIVVRGNAPKGLLWRLDGVEIPAPNHLSGVYNGGGIETVFSSNLLNNSDFFTSAFPAEYGNALSGVFDIQLRNGNTRHRESAIQMGSQGIDVSSEGPLKKGGNASYLFNYRYSTLGLVNNLLSLDVGLPSYQDLCFKFHLPTKKAGNFYVWSINGLSEVEFNPDEDMSTWETSWDNNQYSTQSDISASGLNHTIRVLPKGYLRSSVAFSCQHFGVISDQHQRDNSVIPLANHNEKNYRVSYISYLNYKFSPKHSNRTGFNVNRISFDHFIRGNTDPSVSNSLDTLVNQADHSYYFQAYSQSRIRISPRFSISGGLQLFNFYFTNETIVEPRLGIKMSPVEKHEFSLAYGKHSRLEPLRFYLAMNDGEYLNADLQVTKAHHFVLAYDWRISNLMHLKLEPYYQSLFDVPVIDETPTSLLNYQNDMYFSTALSNRGAGSNIGADITIERYMNQGYYYMFTGSVFESKYKGGDGIERNTAYNRNYVFNFLGGKEWMVRKNNVFSLNGKFSIMGGNRFTPPDNVRSIEREMVVEDASRTYEWQESAKFYLDLSINYRINKKKHAQIFILQVKNLFMQSEVFGWAYNFNDQTVAPQEMTMMYPYISYKIEF